MVAIRLDTEEKRNSVIGKEVVDTEGVSIGFVEAADEDALVIGEGFSDEFVLSLDLVDSIDENITLKDTLYELLMQSRVYDKDNQFIGVVVEVIEADDTLDTLVIRKGEPREGEELKEEDLEYILMEEIADIEWKEIYLKIKADELKLHDPEHPVRDVIFEKILHLFGRD